MTKPIKMQTSEATSLLKAAENAAQAIPLVWPLASSVAVNPYLGQTGETLAATGARLARVGGVPVTMPRSWFHKKIVDGTILEEDLAGALEAAPTKPEGLTVATLRDKASDLTPDLEAVPTLADLAAQASGIDWPGIIEERFGAWAACRFDKGQAVWAAPAGPAWTAWRGEATHDLTPEIAGLKGFAAKVDLAPAQPEVMIAEAVDRLGLSQQALPTYFHQLLFTLGGWAHMARQQLWNAELKGGTDPILIDFLAIRLFWEVALFDQYAADIAEPWARARSQHEEPVAPSEPFIVNAILQDAADRASQRTLGETLAKKAAPSPHDRPALQAAFCIDVRSEVFRRSLEAVSPQIETLGFAGFFGLATSHRGFASDVEELRLPVLLNPGLGSCSGSAAHREEDQTARFTARAKRAWGRFKLAAVSSFAFVEAAGPIYIGKLVRDGLGMPAKGGAHEPAPQLDPAVDLETKIGAAQTILGAMSLTDNFARLVLLLGHGANVVNNPHESALHCGACGGYSGEVNARLLAGLLNDPAVRAGLKERGLIIPDDTLFIGGLHDTTTDDITLYTADQAEFTHRADIAQTREWLDEAGRAARGERAIRLPRAGKETEIKRRSRDWAETRAEWALAGCKAFIAAPRERTRGKALWGRAFLHTYDWRQDTDFKVLELILTAPVVVASWISLQYYGSTVSPKAFGGGNKLLHNVTGGVGVVEGNGGSLRVGLPWQSVHDGEALVHEPVRLSVCVEAPKEAIVAILKAHPQVAELFDNGWLHLFVMDDEGRLASRYTGKGQWDGLSAEKAAEPALKAAS